LCAVQREKFTSGFLVCRQQLSIVGANVDASPAREEVVHGGIEVPTAVAETLVEGVSLVAYEQVALDERMHDIRIEAAVVGPVGGR
jgi:hypothetical protein